MYICNMYGQDDQLLWSFIVVNVRDSVALGYVGGFRFLRWNADWPSPQLSYFSSRVSRKEKPIRWLNNWELRLPC